MMSQIQEKKYDKNNIFMQIISKKQSANKIYEDENILIIKDIFPKAKIHLLAIPKGEYIDYGDFVTNAHSDLIIKFFKTIEMVMQEQDIREYKLLTNQGKEAGQEIFHFHFHILAN